MSTQQEQNKPIVSKPVDDAVWVARRRNNVRIAWGIAAFVAAIFIISILKYRPL